MAHSGRRRQRREEGKEGGMEWKNGGEREAKLNRWGGGGRRDYGREEGESRSKMRKREGGRGTREREGRGAAEEEEEGMK